MSDFHKENSKKIISFTVGNQEYGVGILSVREIRGWTEATPLPDTPPAIRGVINLRGIILPVIDMRRFFLLENREENVRDVVIIVDVGVKIFGIIVDKVSDIIDVDVNSIQDVPNTKKNKTTSNLICGLLALDERTVGVIDLERLSSELLSPELAL